MELRRQFRVRVIRALTAAAPIIAAALGVLALVTAAPTSAVQSIPYLINFQGRLTDNNGNVLADGSYNVKFRIFDAATSGTNLWEGDRVYGASDHRITVQNGLFNIQFGDSTAGDPALSPSLFNTQTHPGLYLEVELPTPGTASCASNGCATWTEGAMTPRQPLASATYAFNSDTLDGLDSGAFVQLSVAQQTGSINVSGNITAGGALQTADAVFTNGSNSNTVTLQAGNTSGNYTLTLPTGQATGTSVLQNDGLGNLSWAAPGTCADCVLNDSAITSATNTIAPTTDVSALTIHQTSASSPTKNIFAVTNSAGTTTFLRVDQNGQVGVGQASTTNGQITFYNGTNAATASIYNDGNLHVDAGSNNVWIDSSSLYLNANTHSNVGINTSSPSDMLTVNGNIQVRDADAATKGFRLRTGGPAVDLESGGAQLYLSTWSAASFSGTQYVQFIFDNAGGDIAAQRSMLFATGADRSIYVQTAASGNNGNNLTVQGGTGNGTDKTGGNLVLAGGAGTGAGVGGNINFQVAKPGTTGSGANSLGTVLSLSGTDGSATFSNTVNLTGVPPASSQLLELGPNSLSGGSSSGTYIGANPTSFSGDFENFQVNGSTRLKVTNFGDVSGGMTSLGVSSTTSGTATNKTSMTLASAAGFTIGYYIQLNDAACANGTTCYAKITGISSNTLTITPALSWSSGSTVNEYYVPEVGGTDLTSTLANRYGRGYFIAGVATGNGTTYYNEDSITSSLSSFDLLTSATTINIGGASTTVSLPGALTVGGQSVINSSGQINGAELQSGSVANTALANPSLSVNTAGNLAGGGSVALGGSLNLSFSNSPTFSTSVTTPALNATSTFLLQPSTDSSTAFQVLSSSGTGSRGVLVVGTSNTQISADANLIVNSSVSVPSITSAAYAGNNTAGSLSGAAGTTYFYRVSAIVGSETAASGETWVSSTTFGTLSAPTAPTTAATTSGGSLTGSQTYSYKVTFVTANGETVTSAVSNSQTTTNTKLTIPVTVPTYTGAGSGIVTARKLYRTTGNGSTYLLVNTGTNLSNNTTTTFNDGTADNTLGAAEPSSNTATTNANEVTVTFPAFTGATGYRIYRGTSTHGEDHYQTAGSCAGTCTFTDTGAAGTAGTPIEPTAGRVGIGTTTPDYALDVTGNVSATSAYIANGNVGQTQTCGAGNTFSGLTITGGIVTATGSCTSLSGGSVSATLQSAYGNSTSPQITLTSGGGTLTVRDAATPIGTDLFDVQNNAGTTTYLGVSTTGLVTSGSMNIGAGQTYQVGGTQISTSNLSNGSNITLQGNSFNGTSQLVQTTSGGALPALSGANLTALNPTNLAAGSGAITLASGTGTGLTLDAAGGTLVFGSNTTTLQKAASALAIDLTTAGTSTLTIKNSNGANVANLSVSGTINGATVTGGSLSTSAVNGLSVSGGTITVGTWNGTAVDAAHGGTGQSTFAIGDLLFASSSTALSKLSEPASAGSCLVSGATGSTGPSWSSCSSASGAATNLNNLVTTSINQSLLPNANNSLDIGSASLVWAHVFTGVVDAGSTTTTLSVGATNASTLNIGNSTAATATNIQGGTTGGLNLGATGSSTTGSTVHIADTSNATGTQAVTIGSNANAANSLDIDAGNTGKIQIGDTATAHTIQIGTGAAVQTISVGSGNSTSQTTVSGGVINTSGGAGVIIGGGFSTSDTNLIALTLDSSSTFSETAGTCSSSVNDGALYYNSNASSSAVRGCINGNWEDIVSTSGLGIILFGVVPDSSTGANIGDLAAAGASGANSSGPCKVYLGGTTKTVNWTACTAYSGGRKVIVTAGTSGALTTTASSWAHVCLTGTNNQPAVSAFGTETASANLPAFSANSPVLCLADISTGTGQGNITGIYDTRTFTTSTHEFAQSTTALALGVPVIPSGANVAQVGASATANIAGVVVATHGDTTGTPNVIIATGGPVWAKASGGSAGGVVITSTTAGRVTTGTSVAGPYGDMGLARTTFNSTCTASTATSCQTSIFFDFFPR